MKIFFTAWLMINGAWTHGSYEFGWYPIDTGSVAACEKALAFASASVASDELMFTCETKEDTLQYMRDLQR